MTSNGTITANVTEAIIANFTSSEVFSNLTAIPAATSADLLTPKSEDDYFFQGLYQSFLLVFLAEIGDKTFIMVMLLANKMNKFVLWILATIAMNIMNAISVTIGAIFPLFMPKAVISIVVIVLFFTFGLKMFYNALCA
jgi:Ca2+/H+ antiporter, TMEM165/GDT1 family